MTSYTHLSNLERKEIADMIRRGYSNKRIARILGRSVTTIGREIARNGTKKGYDPKVARNMSRNRRKCSKFQGMKVENDRKLRAYIVEKLEDEWTPEMISGRIACGHERWLSYISSKGIYRWLYSVWWQRYCRYLVSKKKKPGRKKKRGKKVMIPDRIGIEKRPIEADLREEVGHWEIDTAVSGKRTKSKTALCVMVDRKSRYCCLEKIPNLKWSSMNQAIIKRLRYLPRKTLTYDNGVENTKHVILRPILAVVTYFCDAFSSWQKGTVENTIGRIRRDIPKWSDIWRWSKKQIQDIEHKLNHTPKRCLDYKTPLEVMTEALQCELSETPKPPIILSCHDD